MADKTLEDLSLDKSHAVLIAKEKQSIARLDVILFACITRDYYLSFVTHLHYSEDVFTVFFLHKKLD